MFNSLLYIPNILAYTFITLLVVILGFIVIYVTHKIYTSIYDNLPVAQLSSKSSLSSKIKTLAQPSSILALGAVAADAQIAGRKSKTALRIIVTLEPCYLAYMVFESKLISFHPPHLNRKTKDFASNTASSLSSSESSLSSKSSLSSSVSSSISFENNYKLIKYYDSLSHIPIVRDFQNCDTFKLNKVINN